MVLILDTDKLEGIRIQAEQTYPEECCGLLVGQWTAQADGTEVRQIVSYIPADNAWDEATAEAMGQLQGMDAEHTKTKASRYWIDPQLMLRVQRESRDRNLDIIGIYHSHPDHPAVPSECDRSLAWPSYSYIIVSVMQGSAADVRCWCLDEAHQFQPEMMRMGAQPPYTFDSPTPKP